jgi:hypothetical protein
MHIFPNLCPLERQREREGEREREREGERETSVTQRSLMKLIIKLISII